MNEQKIQSISNSFQKEIIKMLVDVSNAKTRAEVLKNEKYVRREMKLSLSSAIDGLKRAYSSITRGFPKEHLKILHEQVVSDEAGLLFERITDLFTEFDKDGRDELESLLEMYSKCNSVERKAIRDYAKGCYSVRKVS